jgi:hypothetical protein
MRINNDAFDGGGSSSHASRAAMNMGATLAHKCEKKMMRASIEARTLRKYWSPIAQTIVTSRQRCCVSATAVADMSASSKRCHDDAVVESR